MLFWKMLTKVESIASIVVDPKTVHVKLVDSLGQQAITAFWIAADPEISNLHSPEPEPRITLISRRAKDKSGLAAHIHVRDVGGGTGAFKTAIRMA